MRLPLEAASQRAVAGSSTISVISGGALDFKKRLQAVSSAPQDSSQHVGPSAGQ